ncbi:GPI anchored cell wall protein [Xylariaceae sp. FL0804]|nr:GPI anchored cell wall protein [Xylariaceae sp. FL0804]
MQSLILTLAFLGAALASPPWRMAHKRPLLPHQWAREPSTGCPAYLEPGNFSSPSYITHVSQKHPDQSFGPQQTGVFTPNDLASIFSFDVPASRTDANCTLEFLFPSRNQLAPGEPPFLYEGGGSFFFSGYNPGSCPGPQTTYNNQPEPGPFGAFPPIHMEPGFAYTIDVGPCFVSAGLCAAGMTSTNDTHFSFVQNSRTCPIGIYTAYSYGLPA